LLNIWGMQISMTRAPRRSRPSEPCRDDQRGRPSRCLQHERCCAL